MQANFLESQIFSLGELSFTWGQGALWLILSICTIMVLGFTRRALNKYATAHELPPAQISRISILSYATILLIWLVTSIYVLGLDYSIISRSSIDLKVTGILGVICIILLARIADALISARILEEMENRHALEILQGQYGAKDQRTKIIKLIHYSLITVVLAVAVRLFDADRTLLRFNEGTDSEVTITIINIISAILVVLIARVIFWMLVNLFLYGWYHRNRIDLGKQYAYNQLLSYVIYTFAVIVAMQYLGLNFTLLWAGAAALLVGIGIALQQVISDFFSGLVLLFERSVEVGDFLDFGTYAGTVKKIGLRASIIETLERKDIFIPNSQLVNQNVINLTSTRPITRFQVDVGVAYGSDTAKVKELLLSTVQEVDGVMKSPVPFVRFVDFGSSSLDFSVLFYSVDMIHIEDIKSNIRFAIDQAFRDADIEVPFPQRDVWIKGK